MDFSCPLSQIEIEKKNTPIVYLPSHCSLPSSHFKWSDMKQTCYATLLTLDYHKGASINNVDLPNVNDTLFIQYI